MQMYMQVRICKLSKAQPTSIKGDRLRPKFSYSNTQGEVLPVFSTTSLGGGGSTGSGGGQRVYKETICLLLCRLRRSDCCRYIRTLM